jgi:hypothetical protein
MMLQDAIRPACALHLPGKVDSQSRNIASATFLGAMATPMAPIFIGGQAQERFTAQGAWLKEKQSMRYYVQPCTKGNSLLLPNRPSGVSR